MGSSGRREHSYAKVKERSEYRPASFRRSYIEPEQHDIPVLDQIILALQAPLACIPGARFPPVVDVVGKGDALGPDKALFKIRMDDAGGGRCGAAPAYRPGADLFGAGGK